jgi:acyl dehydratase
MMADTGIFYEDVEMGYEIGPLRVEMKRRQIVNFVKEARLNFRRFTDEEYARSEGLGGAIVPGSYSMSLFSRMLTDRFGVGSIKKLGVNYRGLIHHGEVMVCRGMVINKLVDGGEHLLECDVFMENQRGEKPIKGNATILIPSRM